MPTPRPEIALASWRVEKPGWKISRRSRSTLRVLVGAEQAEAAGLGGDRRVVEPPAVVPNRQDQRVPLPTGLQA